MKAIAIIPARGGSKRFPGKNLAKLAGKPLLQYSIDYALAHSELINGVYVSTDDLQIKETALELGAAVIDRPEELASDTASTAAVLKHALSAIEDTAEHVVLLQPTNPLRPDSLLTQAMEQYLQGDFDSLMTVTRSYHKLGRIAGERFQPYNYSMGQRSQDLEALYFENGLLYITRAPYIEKGVILAERNLPFVVDSPMATVDIDHRTDLEWAEFLLRKQ